MKILHLFNSFVAAAFVMLATVANAQNYTDVYGGYNYKGNLKVRDTTFLKRLIVGDCALDSSALVQFNSSCKGILVPRLTTVQKDSISHPAQGLLVYDISIGCFSYYSDTLWVSMCAGSQQLKLDSAGIHFVGKDTLSGVLTDWTAKGSSGNSYFIAVITNSGKMGIGASNPTATFQIGDSLNPKTFKYVDGNQGVGKVLTSDINGNATWQPAAGGGGGTGWGLNGNTGAGTGTSYLGTADSNGLVFKTNGTTFGYIDSLQMFNFSTNIDSDTYGMQTSNNLLGDSVTGMFTGDESAGVGFYVLDGRQFGFSKHLNVIGDFDNSHFLRDDSLINIQSAGPMEINAKDGIQIESDNTGLEIDKARLDIDAPLITEFYANILPDSIADSSNVNSNVVTSGATFGNNTLSGGAQVSGNFLTGGGSSCTGNVLVGIGTVNGWGPGINSNQMYAASHLDSNYLEGFAKIWGVGKHSAYSNFSHNYLRNISSLVQIYGISGESGESVVWDTITGDDYSEIFNLTLMSFDSVAYNVLSGPYTNINNLIMQNSDLNYCHFSSPNTGFIFSQLFNSRIVHDTVNVVNCFFHNVNKDFTTETQPWSNIMLLNDNVGIGITSKPVATLQVGDDATPQSFRYEDGNQGSGKVLTSDVYGNATWQLPVATGATSFDSTALFAPGASDTIAPGDTIVVSDTVAVLPYRYNIIDSTGALSNLTVSLPASPAEGEWVEVKLVQSGVLIHYLNGAVANSAPTYIAPSNLYIKLVFCEAKNTWY